MYAESSFTKEQDILIQVSKFSYIAELKLEELPQHHCMPESLVAIFHQYHTTPMFSFCKTSILTIYIPKPDKHRVSDAGRPIQRQNTPKPGMSKTSMCLHPSLSSASSACSRLAILIPVT